MVVLYQTFDAVETCSDAYVCRCLRVTETTLEDAMDRCPMRNLQDVARETGAGSGCTACHRLIRKYIAARAGANLVDAYGF